MIQPNITLMEATQHWVYGFNVIPTVMIARLMKHNPDEWTEVTLPVIGDTVYVYDEDTNGTITAQVDDSYQIILENGINITATVDDFTLVQNDILPCWGTMWSFGESVDVYWLANGAGLMALSECGFRVFYHEDFGYFFGIDGAGYDFYTEHWIPLYKARGLHWHKKF